MIMSIYLRITLLVAILVYFLCIFYLLKKKRLELRYTLLWIFGGIVMIFILLFPNVITFLLKYTGIAEEVNAVFASVIFIMIIILISITSIVSKLNSDLRRLIQKCALYEKRIRELEEQIK